jgi:glycosyltransferase involved in cell wall biosynthesis
METYGGAERVTQELARAFPEAPVLAVLGRPAVAARMGIADRFRSVLPPRTRLLRHYRVLTPLFPLIVERARLPEADLLLSSSYAFAHRFATPNGAPQVCYCHSPLRFAWSMTEGYRERLARRPGSGPAFDALAAAMRRSDLRASRRVERYLTQSPFTAEQIERFYGRTAEPIGAPVDCDLFAPGPDPPDDYFLLCGRLVEPYKRVSMAMDAFRELPHRLVVAGTGPALGELRAAAPPNVDFAGHLEDRALVELMRRCRAGVFPSRDDFGLMPVEVMACGRPVLAYGAGGALYTVRPGVTGELFEPQSSAALAQALRDFDADAYDPAQIREHALQWDSARFRERVVRAVNETVAEAGLPA